MKKKVIKRRLNRKIVTKAFFIMLLIGLFFLAKDLINTNHFVIKGNTVLKDYEIIKLAGYENYPKLFSKSNYEIKEQLLKSDFIEDAKVSKNLFGEIRITITEAKPLFFDRVTNKLVLSNNKQIANKEIPGLPFLLTSVPENIYARLVTSFANINDDVRALVSEIIYDPWKSNDTIIDDTRFYLKMNDGNHVYINLINLNKLNNYIEIYATLEGKKGILYLDSSSDKISFSLFKE